MCQISLGGLPTFEFHDHTPPTHLGDYIEVFEDKTSTLTINDRSSFKFEKPTVTTPNFDHTYSTIWVHFKIHNGTFFKPYLRVNPEWFPQIDLYCIKDNQLLDSTTFGAVFPKRNRPLNISAPNTTLNIGYGKTVDVYLKLKSDHIITFDLTVADDASHYASHAMDILFFYIFIGVMCCVLIYNFVLSISSSRIGNYFFVLYILCLIINTSFVKGFHDVIHTPYLSIHSNIFSSLMVLFLLESIVHLTSLKTISKKLHYARYIIMLPALVSLILNLTDHVLLANTIIINTSFFGAIWGVIVGIRIIKAGETGSITIFTAFACFIIGGVTHVLGIKGIIPINILTTNAYVIGSGFQVIFFSFYLASKLYNIRKERYMAQQQVLEEIQKNEQLVKQQNIELERKVAERTSQLQKQNKIIKSKNKHITDSINYASYIQNAHLIPTEYLKKSCEDSFVFYKPKDVLSGDFYYFTETPTHFFYVSADCTGHGVPGALLSITGHSILKEIILLEHIVDPSKILERLNIEFHKTLHQDDNNNQDGMDITIVVREKSHNKLLFAGAKNPLVYIKNKELNIIKGDRISIGGQETKNHFTTHEIEFDEPTILYIYSDGYQDQFDSTNVHKFRTDKFRKLLLDIHQLPCNQQYTILEDTILEWRGKEPQTDDILVMGIKLDLV